jgi:hypothetical protein
MLAYYISGSNNYTIRVEPTGSQQLTLHLQDMYLLTNQSQSLSYTYNNYESILSFTASIQSANVADEYRAYISNGTSSIWHGSFQVYASQSVDTPVYKTQNDQYVSNLTDNKYIILFNFYL